jgi:TolA-binding protein
VSDTVIVAIIAFLGSLAGTLGGIVAASKLTIYRLEQLVKKMDKHNGLIERMTEVELRVKVSEHRIEDLEDSNKRIGGLQHASN